MGINMLILLMLGLIGGVLAQDVTTTTVDPPRREPGVSNIPCAVGDYGTLCSYQCHCLNGAACDRSTGHCPSGCVVGYRAPICSDCDTGYFGPFCNETCHCLNETACDPVDGKCFGGCVEGYVGDTCQNLTGGPVVESFSFDDIVNVHQHTTVTCTTSGAPLPNITISSSNFTAIPNSTSEAFFDGNKFRLVTFEAGNTSGVADLLCRATNVHGVADYPINILVVDPPRLLEPPRIVNVQADSVDLTWKPWDSKVDFGGSDQDHPDYKVIYRIIENFNWSDGSDWQPITTATVNQLLPDTDYGFAIRSQRPGDGGDGPPSPFAQQFTKCRSPNANGIPKNLTAVVTLPTSVHLIWQPPEHVDLGCTLMHYVLDYHVKGSTDYQKTTVAAGLAELRLTNLKPETQYVLALMTKTSLGPGLTHAEITIETPKYQVPNPVEGLTQDSALSGPRHVVISWSKPTNVDDADIKEYAVEAKLAGMGACPGGIPTGKYTYLVQVNTTQSKAKVTKLYPYTSYNVTILTISKTNHSGAPASIAIMTSEDAPEAQPPKIMVMEESQAQLAFRWDPIPCHLRNGALNYSYSLQLNPGSNRTKRQTDNWIVKDQITSDLNATISGLTPSTSYEFSVKGVTAAGPGPLTTYVQRTIDDLPPPPVVKISSVRSTAVYMKVLPPQNPGGKIEIYEMQILSESDPSFERTSNLSTTQRLHSESLLSPSTAYKVQIRSLNKLGWGPWSPPVEFYTDGLPAAPTILSVDQFNNSAITVHWRPPENPKLIIITYKLEVMQEGIEDKNLSIVSYETNDNFTTRVTLDGLLSNHSYVVFVSASTKTGYGLSDNRTIFLNQTVIAAPPIIMDCRQLNDTTLRVKWLPPFNVPENVLSYRVEYALKRDSGDVTISSYETDDNSTMEMNLTGLEPDGVYEVLVRARTISGYGDPSRRTYEMASADDGSRAAIPVHNPPPLPVVIDSQVNEDDPETMRANIRIMPIPSESGFQPRVYEVVVAEVGQKDNLNETKLLDHKAALKTGHPYWIAARIPASTESLDFVVGDKKIHLGYYNGPLRSDVEYSVMVRAVGKSDKEISFLSPIAVISKPGDATSDAFLGHCRVLGISCVLFLLIIIAILFLFWIILVAIILCQRRKKKKSKRIQISTISGKNDGVFAKSYCPASERTIEEETALTLLVPSNDVPKKTETFKKASFFGPIPVGDLADYIANRAAHPTITFQEEFKQSTGEHMAPWDVAKKAENLKKNRYGNILPFDRNRVRLEPLPGISDSDYINASYVDGYDKPKVYIATQGPKDNTFHDFWRMVWQERVAAIVMLTALIENKKKKCDQYWPNQTRLFGDILVTLSVTEHLADIVVRHFELKKVGTNESHLVKHYHFADWPDLGIPPCITSMLHLRRKVREELPTHCGPIVVHCSAGAGRAGTFIAIDAMLKQAYDEEIVYIFHFVRSMQAQRIHLVQTVEQYKFVYNTILEALQSGDTKVMCTRLPVYFREISRTSETEQSDLAEQFKTLNKLEQRKSCVPCPEALSDDNSAKNRNQAILPIEHSRVRLQSVYVDDSLCIPVHDPYINAVLCDGFKQKGHFLVTHMPLDCTIEDFWRMVVKHKSSVIIMLNDCEFIDENVVPGQYWPNDGCTQHGPFQVEVVTFEEKGMVNFRTLRVIDCRKINFEPHSVIQLQFLDWAPSKLVPSSTSSMVSLLNMTDVLQRKYGGPITVHCTDGASRSGLFCTSHVLKEQVESGQVDVFNAIKRLRRHRPQFITSVEQYQYCYEIAMELLSFCNGCSTTSGSTIACESC